MDNQTVTYINELGFPYEILLVMHKALEKAKKKQAEYIDQMLIAKITTD